ncbi:MAG TPA: hypothetical protein VGH19_12500 [Verrucomicrobiae bacterium]
MTFHPSFKFILVYEDRPAGLRAKEMSDRLATMLEPECHVTTEAWNFALLSDSLLRDVAAEDARQAHMVIISAHKITALPTHVKSWLEEWLPAREGGKGALVFLLGDKDQNEHISEYALACDDLKNLTNVNAMDFFCSHHSQITTPANVIKMPSAKSELFSDAV